MYLYHVAKDMRDFFLGYEMCVLFLSKDIWETDCFTEEEKEATKH